MQSTPSKSVGDVTKALFQTPERERQQRDAQAVAEFVPDASDNIKVYLRIRPRVSNEFNEMAALKKSTTSCIEVSNNSVSNAGKYYFDHVFDDIAGQQQVYKKTTRGLVHSLFTGVSSLVFAYGITNAGKTHTVHGTDPEPGVLPNLLSSVYNIMEAREDPSKTDLVNQEFDSVEDFENLCSKAVNANSGCKKISVVISCLEIYNEKLSDLLVSSSKRQELRMVEENSDICVRGAREVECPTLEDAKSYIKQARAKLQMGATNLNHASSRSHSLYIISLFRYTNAEYCLGEIVAKLIVCDLAGSERTNRTQNTGARLKEAANINQSLMVLGRCLEVLRWNQTHPAAQKRVVPFRDAKLTRLMQGTLSGNGKTVMIVNVSPCVKDIDETVHVLNYSSVAKEVTQVTAPSTGTPKRKMQLANNDSMAPPISNMQQAMDEIHQLSLQVSDSKTQIIQKEWDIRKDMSRQWQDSIKTYWTECVYMLENHNQSQKQQADKSLKSQKDVYEAKIKSLQYQLMSLQQQVPTGEKKGLVMLEEKQANDAKLKQLEDTLMELTKAMSEKSSEVDQMKSENKELKQSVNKVQKQKETEIAGMQVDLSSIQTKYTQLKSNLERSQQEERKWHQLYTDVNTTKKSMEDERKMLEEKLDIEEKKQRELKQQFQQQHADSSKHDREKAELLRQLRVAEQRNESLEKSLKAEENIQANQKKTIDSLTTANQHATNTINSQNAIAEQHKQDIQNHIKSENMLREDLSTMTKIHDQQQKAIQQLKTELIHWMKGEPNDNFDINAVLGHPLLNCQLPANAISDDVTYTTSRLIIDTPQSLHTPPIKNCSKHSILSKSRQASPGPSGHSSSVRAGTSRNRTPSCKTQHSRISPTPTRPPTSTTPQHVPNSSHFGTSVYTSSRDPTPRHTHTTPRTEKDPNQPITVDSEEDDSNTMTATHMTVGQTTNTHKSKVVYKKSSLHTGPSPRQSPQRCRTVFTSSHSPVDTARHTRHNSHTTSTPTPIASHHHHHTTSTPHSHLSIPHQTTSSLVSPSNQLTSARHPSLTRHGSHSASTSPTTQQRSSSKPTTLTNTHTHPLHTHATHHGTTATTSTIVIPSYFTSTSHRSTSPGTAGTGTTPLPSAADGGLRGGYNTVTPTTVTTAHV